MIRKSCGCGRCRKCKDRIRKKQAYDAMTLQQKRAKAARRNLAKRRASQRRARLRHVARYPEKIRARKAVAHALRSGRLVRQPCEVCGDSDVEAHHDDYDQPLEVRWFCKRHHIDRAKQKGGTGI